MAKLKARGRQEIFHGRQKGPPVDPRQSSFANRF